MFETPLGDLPAFGEAPLALSVQPHRPDASATKMSSSNLDEIFELFEIDHGQVLSFHHHYRNGDHLLNAVVETANRRGLCDLTIMASSIFPVHQPLVQSIKDRTIKNVICDYMRGPVAEAISNGFLSGIALLQSHGGRARAIAARQIEIDVAFVAAPLAHECGAVTGRGGVLACGPLGYPAVDAAYAKRTVVAAHKITSERLQHEDISAHFVDALLHFPNPGDTAGIQSGSTVPNSSPTAQNIATRVAQVIEATGNLRNGMSLQSGAGGYSLGAVPSIGQRMAGAGVTGTFLSGGITGAHTKMLEEGLFQRIRDVQCFDEVAILSSIANPDHQMMTAAEYASPLLPNACVNELSIMLLGAAQIDQNFNVNVVLGGDGSILGGPGGHPDTAQGANLSIVTTTLTGGGYSKFLPKVDCISTPGPDIDVVVTDVGIAVNPARSDMVSDLHTAGIETKSIYELVEEAQSRSTSRADMRKKSSSERILVEHRNGTILDVA